jgi:thymidine phosphorylase
VRGGEPLFTLHTDTPERFSRALEALDGAIEIQHSETGATYTPTPLILDRIGR